MQTVNRNEKAVFPFSLGLLLVGTVGYFLQSRETWLFYVLAHLGALGVMGLFGWAAGTIARRRNRSYWTAFSLGFGLSIVSGIVAVLIFLWGVNGNLYCGGAVSLVVGIQTLLGYLLTRKKSPLQTNHTG